MKKKNEKNCEKKGKKLMKKLKKNEKKTGEKMMKNEKKLCAFLNFHKFCLILIFPIFPLPNVPPPMGTNGPPI